ncbi:CCR4-NOT transcription complex subunit 1 [Camellia lanceoleosa]|uniref:CCR4-NOT transcription complex subunit 1 n=1 Tax=Camellia lanceoleosa TaxID=1840588 RepID=A0ACC0FN12_9ERIC|nr:CCR4-NOT transcription complex subunit 1 [Camellia lanceoleosa]
MIHFLYKGTLRVLLLLLHDFPEFLCDYHFSFCDVIPSSCIQMRNVILSAFPHNMRLLDPSTPYLKIDLLAEINQSPHIFSEVDAALKAKQMKSDVDEYLKVLWSFINVVYSYAFLLLYLDVDIGQDRYSSSSDGSKDLMDNLTEADIETGLSIEIGYIGLGNFNSMMVLENGALEEDVTKYICNGGTSIKLVQ